MDRSWPQYGPLATLVHAATGSLEKLRAYRNGNHSFVIHIGTE